MKDNRPIAVQVAELTDEQRANIPNIYKKHFIFSVCTVLVEFVLMAITAFMYIKAEAMYKEYNSIGLNTFDLGNIQKRSELWQNYDKMSDLVFIMFIVIMVYSVIMIIASLLVKSYITKKYPYYSEKRYRYIKAFNKSANRIH